MTTERITVNDNDIIEVDASQFLFPGISKITYTYNRVFQTLVVKVNKTEVFAEAGLLAENLFRKTGFLFPTFTREQEESRIEKMVEYVFGIRIGIIKQRTRERSVVELRQILMWWTKGNTKWSLSEIGTFYGDYDHATVLHSVRTVDNLRMTNNAFNEKVELFLKKANEFQIETANTQSHE